MIETKWRYAVVKFAFILLLMWRALGFCDKYSHFPFLRTQMNSYGVGWINICICSLFAYHFS
jgi:hypothetical protein